MYQEDKEYNVIRGIVPDFGYDLKLAIYVDGERRETLPTEKDYYVNIKCDNDINAEWDYDNWRPIIPNILKTTKCNIEYESVNNFEKLKEKLGVNDNNIDDLLKNNIDNLVNSKEGMLYLAKSPELLDSLRTSANYTDDVKQKILDSTIIDEDTKYAAGLPCYIFKNGTQNAQFAGEMMLTRVFSTKNTEGIHDVWFTHEINKFEVSYANSYGILSTKNKIDLNKYSSILLNFRHYSNYPKQDTLSTIVTFEANAFLGGREISQNSFSETYKDYNSISVQSSLKVNIENINEKAYIRIKLEHGPEAEMNTVGIDLDSMVLY